MKSINFADVIKTKQFCPVCNEKLILNISTEDFCIIMDLKDAKSLKADLVKKLEKYFDGALNNEKVKYIIGTAVIADEKILKLKDGFEIDLLKCTAKVSKSNMELTAGSFGFELICKKEHFEKDLEYQLKGNFYFELYQDDTKFLDENIVEIQNSALIVDYERYTIENLHLNETPPCGQVVKIINDYCNDKTSFSIVGVDFNGNGNFKEKRIDLVDEDYFNYSNANSVCNRINAIFYLE